VELPAACRPKANLRAPATPLNRNRRANTRPVLHCASQMPRCERRRRVMGRSSLGTDANRGTCDALAVHHNTARPDADSSLAGPAIACMHHRQTASQQSPRLTANLLDPLVAPRCSLTPPPRYCTQLHTRQPHSWLPSAALIPPSHLPVRPSKGAKKFFLDSFRIVFERFEGFSRKRDPSPPNWILKHEYAARESAFPRTAR
jgi:hypothetical protein